MQSRNEVVVVDGLPETEEVLRAVLEPRGIDVVRVQSSASSGGLSFHDTSVLVLHGDEPAEGSLEISQRSSAPRVFIGRIPVANETQGEKCRCLSQPFQYADLISAIEELTVSTSV